MKNPIIILAREKSLSFNGYTEDAIALVNSLREAYTYTDMPKMLNDFVFNIEVALVLGITAETDEKRDLAIQLAKLIAIGMPREQVEAAKSAAAQMAEGL